MAELASGGARTGEAPGGAPGDGPGAGRQRVGFGRNRGRGFVRDRGRARACAKRSQRTVLPHHNQSEELFQRLLQRRHSQCGGTLGDGRPRRAGHGRAGGRPTHGRPAGRGMSRAGKGGTRTERDETGRNGSGGSVRRRRERRASGKSSGKPIERSAAAAAAAAAEPPELAAVRPLSPRTQRRNRRAPRGTEERNKQKPKAIPVREVTRGPDSGVPAPHHPHGEEVFF
ncbi:uncharacterized protein LOC121358771 [Pyrgilauda ruficollis]|uniref:uncharacterized protein LOC121358771 n=1 Tax=Pyrgilauda ruficollis TaxID=221976 RepID=UPI001B86EFC6|nr:uncharacterized protein LOC121358771 [Pyrgilauda ruficollis]